MRLGLPAANQPPLFLRHDDARQRPKLVKEMVDREVSIEELGGVRGREAALEKDGVEVLFHKARGCMCPHSPIARAATDAVGFHIPKEEHLPPCPPVDDEKGSRIQRRRRSILDRYTAWWRLCARSSRHPRRHGARAPA